MIRNQLETTTNTSTWTRDHGAAWLHGTGSGWWPQLQLSNVFAGGHPLGNDDDDDDVNPMLELLRQETMMMQPHHHNDTTTTSRKDAVQRHLNPVFPQGNPWIRPKTVLHNHQALQLYVAGRALDVSDNSMIDRALHKHFDLLQRVHDLGKQKFIEGNGLETVSISLAEAIATVQNEIANSLSDDGAPVNDDVTTTTMDSSMVTAVAPFYRHLLECWYGASSTQLPLCAFVRGGKNKDDRQDSSRVVAVDDNDSYDSHYHPEGDYVGPHCTLRHGMSRVLEPLLQNGVREQIQLGQAVTNISWNASSSSSPITITTAAGWTVHADVCVVTLPSGCLKAAVTEQQPPFFEPPLNPEKVEAIASTQMGAYKKIFLTFDEIFWPMEPPFIGLVRRVGDDTGATIAGDGEDGEDDHPLGNYLLLDNLWAKDGIPSLEAVLFGVSGTWSIHKSNEVLQATVLSFLSQAMGLSLDWLTERCQDCHVTRWEEDPYSRGAYSSMALGALERHTEELRRPEWEGRLVLAGEATISEFEGSVHAALLSGQSAAQKVASVVARGDETDITKRCQ